MNQGQMKKNMPDSSARLGYLDSIRGLAALVVVLSHARMLHPSTTDIPLSLAVHSLSGMLEYVATKIGESGRSAVLIFFVLSGFVLAYSLLNKPMSYKVYAARRFFRIYPAFCAAILLAYAAHATLPMDIEISQAMGWLRAVVYPDMSFLALLKHLAIWGTQDSMELDSVMWSLVHEMRISLIFPLLLAMTCKGRWRSLRFFFELSLCIAIGVYYVTGQRPYGWEATSFLATFLDTAYFIVLFVAGIIIALEQKRLVAFFEHRHWGFTVLLGVAVACGFMKTNLGTTKEAWDGYAGMVGEYMHALCAVGLIVLAVGVPRFGSILNRQPFIWLGRVSYSLYLVHLTVIYVLYRYLGDSLSEPVMTLVIVAASLVAAEILAFTVEYPFMRIGKRVTTA